MLIITIHFQRINRLDFNFNKNLVLILKRMIQTLFKNRLRISYTKKSLSYEVYGSKEILEGYYYPRLT